MMIEVRSFLKRVTARLSRLGPPDPEPRGVPARGAPATGSSAIRQRRLLNLVLAGLAYPGALFGLVMLLLWLLGKTPPSGAIAGLGVQPLYALSYWLGRRGRLKLAAAIPVAAVFLAMLAASFQIGIGHVTYIGYAMATLTAGILIGTRAGLLVAAFSTLANLATGAFQAGGRLPSVYDPVSTVTADSIGMGLGLVVLLVFTGIYGRELKKALLIQQGLSAELQVNQANLELQVRRRTRDLERRLNQIHTAAEISRTISAVLEPEALLQQVVDLIQTRFSLYYAGVFLVDEPQPGVAAASPARGYAVLRAGSGPAGQKMLAEGHKLPLGKPTADGSGEPDSMVGWAIVYRQPRIALDLEEDEIPGTGTGRAEIARFRNPHLPRTRSELALPIVSGGGGRPEGEWLAPEPQTEDSRRPSPGRCLGALTIQSELPGAFDQDDITVLQAIADSLAIALENARLYQQSQANLGEIRTLHRQYLSRAWQGISASASVSGAGTDDFETGAAWPEAPGLFELFQKNVREGTLHGGLNPAEPELQDLRENTWPEGHARYGDPLQTLGPAINAGLSPQGREIRVEIPLILRDQTIGSLTIEGLPTSPTPGEMALIEALANETAIALENARLLDEAQRRAGREHQVTEITARLRASNHPEEIMRTAIRELRQALGASAVRIKGKDEQSNRYYQ